MPRLKEKEKIIHTPTTLEIFYCLSDMVEYSKLLLQHGEHKPYTDFLKWIIEKDFYREEKERSIKRVSESFKTNAAKVTKWIAEIYEDIFILNNTKPGLFQKDGLKVTLRCSHYDSCCLFYISLPVIPREFEAFHFHFVKAKIGVNTFWVKDVVHYLEENNFEILIQLDGGYVNKYREFVLDRAMFEGKIGFGDLTHRHSFDLDNDLKKIYKP